MTTDGFQQTLVPLTFNNHFLEDYAGKLLTNSQISIIELIANSWDAGSTEVRIIWPTSIDGDFSIEDNGTGMTKSDFESIWNEFNYNRIERQGIVVTIPGSSKKRKVYGKNGKGRFGLFCFDEQYLVETWREGISSHFLIKREKNQHFPYSITYIKEEEKKGNGTKIVCKISKNYLERSLVKDLIGSKFIADPSFQIYINNEKIEPSDILDNSESHTYHIPGMGDIKIYIVDSHSPGRTSQTHGVAWWVNNRLVGEQSWSGFEETYLDRRYKAAKRFTIIIIANLLESEVLADWSGFKSTPTMREIRRDVNTHILELIHGLMKEVRGDIKKTAIRENKETIRLLGNISKEDIGKFIDDVQMNCPTINQKHLSSIVGILSKLEESRYGYQLLQNLASVDLYNLDALNEIMKQWSLVEAKTALNELYWRINIIEKIDELIERDCDELHELHPLFEDALWIFGPEFDAVVYYSNKALSTIIRDLYKKKIIIDSRIRPDIVALSDSTISLRCSDHFKANGDIFGIQRVVILELKKGLSTIREEEQFQALKYAKAIKDSGRLDNKNAIITCYVLGTSVDSESITSGENIQIIPTSFQNIIRIAHARTFNIIKKIKEIKGIEEYGDAEISEVLELQEIISTIES